jgi:hypothetical protein
MGMAPNRSAKASRQGNLSEIKIGCAPESLANFKMVNPMQPAPKIATLSATRIFAKSTA